MGGQSVNPPSMILAYKKLATGYGGEHVRRTCKLLRGMPPELSVAVQPLLGMNGTMPNGPPRQKRAPPRAYMHAAPEPVRRPPVYRQASPSWRFYVTPLALALIGASLLVGWLAQDRGGSGQVVIRRGVGVASVPAGSSGGAYYANCSAARAAGVSSIHAGEAGYRSELDRDGDGIACEPWR